MQVPYMVKYNKEEIKMKNNYNPFKMLGSYVGAIVALFIPIPLFSPWGGILFRPMILVFFMGNSFFNLLVLMYLIPVLIIGFLIGYGIHSLIRRLRK